MWGKLHSFCKSLMLVTTDNCGFPFFLTVMMTKTKVKRTFTEGVAGGDCCARGTVLGAKPRGKNLPVTLLQMGFE